MDALTVSIILLAAGLSFFYFGKNGGLIPKIIFPAAFLAIIALNQLTGTEIVMITAGAMLTFFGFPNKMPVEKRKGYEPRRQEEMEEELPEEELPEEELPEEELNEEELSGEETEADSLEEFPEEEPKPLPPRKARKDGY